MFLLKPHLCCLFDCSTFLGMISDISSLAEETAVRNLAVPQEKATLLWGMPPGFTVSVELSSEGWDMFKK